MLDLPKLRQYPTDRLPDVQQILLAKTDMQRDQAAIDELQKMEQRALEELEHHKKEIMNKIEGYHTSINALQCNLAAAMSFIAPIRRLPLEIYREIFLIAKENDENSRIPWIVASVCSLWRQMALNIPNLWATIKFRGTLDISPDIIRLWVERSGSSVPLDIDIRLVQTPLTFPNWHAPNRSRRFAYANSIAMRPLQMPQMPIPPTIDLSIQPKATQWGHVALFYLTAQKFRWRRFVFESIDIPIEALQSLNGPFPLLEEFRVRCNDSTRPPHTNWHWFISQPGGGGHTPSLKKLDLDHVNFSWSSGCLNGLTSLRIHSPSPMIYHPHPTSMDAVYGILLNNPRLQHLDLFVQPLQTSVLPLTSLSLPELVFLSLEGAPHFISLLQHLTVEKLERISVRFDLPQTADFGEVFHELLVRSGTPAVTHLSVQQPHRNDYNLEYFTFLAELRELSLSRLPMEDILAVLDSQETSTAMRCPNLTKISLINCQGRRDLEDIVPRLVKLVERRTDPSVIKTPLTSLKIQNCGCSISGPPADWLKSRLTEFLVDEWQFPGYFEPQSWDIYS